MNTLEIMENMAQFKTEVPAMNTSNNEGTITKSYDYYLACDKENKNIVPHLKDTCMMTLVAIF